MQARGQAAVKFQKSAILRIYTNFFHQSWLGRLGTFGNLF